MCNTAKNILFCPDNIKAIADEITGSGKIAMKKLEDDLGKHLGPIEEVEITKKTLNIK